MDQRRGKAHFNFSVMDSQPLKLQKHSDTRWPACDSTIQVVKQSINRLSITLNQIAEESDATDFDLATLFTISSLASFSCLKFCLFYPVYPT